MIVPRGWGTLVAPFYYARAREVAFGDSGARPSVPDLSEYSARLAPGWAMPDLLLSLEPRQFVACGLLIALERIGGPQLVSRHELLLEPPLCLLDREVQFLTSFPIFLTSLLIAKLP
jgi:hypothetical protein